MKKPAFNKMRSRLFLSIVFAAIAFLGFGCNKDIRDRYVTIQGTVVDSLTKAEISGAWVKPTDTVLVAPWYTDSVGDYRLSIFPASRLWLYVGKSGYKTKSRYFAEIGTDITGIDFELVRDTL
jgi:hypothetical protein